MCIPAVSDMMVTEKLSASPSLSSLLSVQSPINMMYYNQAKTFTTDSRLSAYWDSLLTVGLFARRDFIVTPRELILKVLVTTVDAQWEGMGDVGLARYEPALLPPCLTIRVLSCSN